MLHNDKVLSECIDNIDFVNKFKKINLGKEGSFIFDAILYFRDSTKKITTLEVNLSKEFNLIYRALLYLKFNGKLGFEPINSGLLTYAIELRLVFLEFESIGFYKISDINSKSFDLFLDSLIKKNKPPTVNSKIAKIKEWVLFANKYLPDFLQLEKTVLEHSKLIHSFTSSYGDYLAAYDVGSYRALSDLGSIKNILKSSFSFYKNYKDEIIEVAKYWKEIRVLGKSKRNSKLFDYFKESDAIYKYHFFEKLSINCKKQKLKYIVINKELKTKKLSVKNSHETIIQAISLLESVCVIIILMFTGMRASELVMMNRFPRIERDEQLNLKRMIYKTSATENGEELNIPIPSIVGDVINILSLISKAKDGSNEGKLVISSARSTADKTGTYRIRTLIKNFCEDLGMEGFPSPHQFRHAMAFFLAYDNKKDGIELAKEFLGHSSTAMTLKYLGHYNKFFKEAISEMQQEESKEMVKLLVDDIKDGKKLYGAQGERIMQNITFKGSYADTAADLLDKSLNGLIAKGKVVIIQSSVCMCIHDLTKEEEMACQRGLSIKTFVGEGPQPSRCEGGNCPNAVFREDNINALQREDIDPELYGRLMQNTIFADAGGFDNLPNRRIINQYQKDQEAV